MPQQNKISYIEFPVTNMEASKSFFRDVFDWSFTDYGPDYACFADAGLDGGFVQSAQVANSDTGSALIVLFSNELEATQAKVESAGGQIVKSIFSFPGGRRFHFHDPSGNEFAVWGEL